MKNKSWALFFVVLVAGQTMPLSSYAALGDADGSGEIDMDDARIIARFVTNQVASIPSMSDADASQDGKVDMEDAFIIAKKVSGRSRIVVAAPRYGSVDNLPVGGVIRVEVFEKFFPFNVSGGTVRIQSVSTGYDSGDQPLTFARDGRSLYYHWDTSGLEVASDYEIRVSLTEKEKTARMPSSRVTTKALQAVNQADETVALSDRVFQPAYLASAVDGYAPGNGFPLEFRRVVPHDPDNYPYKGPLGYGWVHSYDIKLEEFTDGRIAFHGPTGFNRFFSANGDGTYTSASGDYGALTRAGDATFTLTEKNGFVYHFRSDLLWDFMEDLNGNRVTASYDSDKRLTKVTHSSGPSFTFTYYDGLDSGQIKSFTDHAGRVTTYEYDSPIGVIQGLQINKPRLAKVIDPTGAEAKYTYKFGQSDKTDNRLIAIEFPDSTFIHYEYDDQARLIKRTGTWGANPVTYSFRADGTTQVTEGNGGNTVIKENDRGQPLVVSEPSGAITNMSYDNAGNLTQVRDALNRITQMSYDEFGNLTQTTNPLGEIVLFGYDLRFNKPSSITDPLGNITGFSFDSRGNLLSTTLPDGAVENFSYDSKGNLVTNQDPVGNTTRYTYDAQGQMTALENALGYTTSFSYDAAGDLKSVVNAKGNTTLYTRDLLGRITRQAYPDGSYESYEYDALGKLTSFTNRRGERITYSYNPAGQLEWKTYPTGRKIRFKYDLSGYYVGADETTGGTSTFIEEYERDAAHRITKVKVPGSVPPASYDVSYAYDSVGNRIFMAYPDGYSLNYEYDAANRLKRISDEQNNSIVSYEYDAAGRRIKKSLGNGTYTTYQYDDVGRLTLLVNYAPDNSVQSRFAYTYNAAGIRTSMTTQDGVHNYSYDDTYQLTAVSYPDGSTASYNFDEVGNRTAVTDNGATTNYTTNSLDQYVQAGSETFSYDANGNLTGRTERENSTTYVWDEDNQLISVDRNGTRIDYRYDLQGRLIEKTIGGQTTRYIWDGLNLIAEMNIDGQVIKRHIYGAGINEIVQVSENGINYWAQQDGLGSVVGTTDDGGSIIASISYDVYGGVKSGNIRPVPQRFAGMWWDVDSGLYYARSRWFYPSVGRFISRDPLNLLDGINLYNYTFNSPTNYIDPLGMKADIGDLFEFINWWQEMIIDFGNAGQGKTRYWNEWRNKWEWGPSFGPNDPEYAWDSNGRLWRNPNYLPPNSPARPENWPKPERYIPPEDWHSWMPYGGGTCPTFIQIIPHSETTTLYTRHHFDVGYEQLSGKIMIPTGNIFLRANSPIYGLAGGKEFKKYWVEYGEGVNPSEWHLINSSTSPQDVLDINIAETLFLHADAHLYGNLADWKVGLKNWSHFPCNPPEDTTDLNGIYTLRLVVTGKNGQQVEDRVTVEVGRVIAQALPGIAVSTDKRVTMRFPEHSLTQPFRIYTVIPFSELDEKAPPPCEGCDMIGEVYRIREPGDRFIKDVTLEFSVSDSDLSGRVATNIGIVQYDPMKKRWNHLETRYDKLGNHFITTLVELPKHKAIYALVYKKGTRLSKALEQVVDEEEAIEPVSPGVLVNNDFEKDLGTFKARDRFVGAGLSRDNSATPDGSYALKLTNINHGGNFSSTVIDQPFDLRAYGTLSFDYRISKDVKIDLFAKINGRWYNLRLTGEPTTFNQRGVNIANAGNVEGIIADDRWHTASIDLRYLLGQQTRHTRVEEIVFANWTVSAYRKLAFGSNAREAAFYVDNLKITGPGKFDEPPATLLVDDFNAERSTNLLGGAFGSYASPGSRYVELSLIDVPAMTVSAAKSSDIERNRALLIQYDVTRPGAYGGFWSSIGDVDLAQYSTLDFSVKANDVVPAVKVGVRNLAGIEGAAYISTYAQPGRRDGWWDISIPLTALQGLPDLHSPDVLFFAFHHQDNSGAGQLWIDDIRLEKAPYAQIADFEQNSERSLIGGNYEVAQSGAAALSVGTMKDLVEKENTVLRLSYGGSIGKDYGLEHGGFSYAGWNAELKGMNAAGFTHLALRIRGEKGGETPNIYLNDGIDRYPMRAKELPEITREWQTWRLPLDHFANNGIDITHLVVMEMVFEWQEQSGTIYVDDIKFE